MEFGKISSLLLLMSFFIRFLTLIKKEFFVLFLELFKFCGFLFLSLI
jgi:hypothetical protein